VIFTENKVPGVFVIGHGRRRVECADESTRAGLDPRVGRINTARNVAAGTLRGVAYKKAAHLEVKYPRCRVRRSGDLRASSPTFC
jgi:hypothetical protein